MALRLVRVDDRLIHGQVVAIWLKALGARRIVILDDRTAADDFLREVITYAAPREVPVEILDVATGTERVRELAALVLLEECRQVHHQVLAVVA